MRVLHTAFAAVEEPTEHFAAIANRKEVTVSDTKHKLEQRIRERAYFLWQQEGCPAGRADQHWEQASEIEGTCEEDDKRIDIEGEDSFPASDPPSHSVAA